MKLRRFTAMSMEEAMAQVRQTLGPDAIIVSTHETKGGRGVEVTAAIEEDMIPARGRPAPPPQLSPESIRRRPMGDDTQLMSANPPSKPPMGQNPGRNPERPTMGRNFEQSLTQAGPDSELEAMARQIQAKIRAQRPDALNSLPMNRQARASDQTDHREPDWAREDRNFDSVAATFNRQQARSGDDAQVPKEAWTPLRPNWRTAPREAVVNPTPRNTKPQVIIPRPAAEPVVDRAPQVAAERKNPPPLNPPSEPAFETAPPTPKSSASAPKISGRDRIIAQALDFHSLPRPIAEALFRAARAIEEDDPVMALAGALESRLVFAPLRQVPRRPTMLIGPVGAGKTVTVAKIAAKAVLIGKRVDVITTDTVRAGAIAQIESYTNVLEQDLGIEETPDGLGERLAGVAEGQSIIIDTAGANPFLTHEMADLALFIAASPGIDPILALSAGGDAREAYEVAQAFRSLGAKRLIITRVDAARRLGSIVAAADAGMTLSQISNSPYVAEGLAPINPVSLATLLISPIAPAIKDHSPEAALI